MLLGSSIGLQWWCDVVWGCVSGRCGVVGIADVVECGVVYGSGVLRGSGYGVGGGFVVVSIVAAGYCGTIGVVVLGDVSMSVMWDVYCGGGGGILVIWVVLVDRCLRLLKFLGISTWVSFLAKSCFP